MARMGSPIVAMLLNGCKYSEICNTLGVAKSSVAYHARKLGLVRGSPIVQQRYDWTAVQANYDLGFCLAEVAENLSIKRSALSDGVRRGFLTVQRNRCCKVARKSRLVSNDMLFTSDSNYDASLVKKRIITDSLLPYTCSAITCPLHKVEHAEWAGAALVLHLDHVNGVRNDHRLVNLRWLCPNCHSQTITYCGRNKKLATGAGIEPAS